MPIQYGHSVTPRVTLHERRHSAGTFPPRRIAGRVEDSIDLCAGRSQTGFMKPPKREKVDREALSSPLMQIPKFDVKAARDLIDQGIYQVYDLAGRSPEVLFEEACKQRPDTPADRIRFFRLAVYVAENGLADRSLLDPNAWA